MVGSLVQFLFTCCEKTQTHSFVCDTLKLVNKNRSSEPAMKSSLYACVRSQNKTVYNMYLFSIYQISE